MDDRIGEARNRVASHPEYKELQSRASLALNAEYTGMTDLYNRAEELRQHATYLYQAYHLTQKEIYAEKLRQLLEALIAAAEYACPLSSGFVALRQTGLFFRSAAHDGVLL